MRHLQLAGLLLFTLLSSCALTGAVVGEMNDVSYRMSTKRKPVPGGKLPLDLLIVMDKRDGPVGSLSIDGVYYGKVKRSDRVRVDDQAVVTVNGDERQPVKEGEEAPASKATSQKSDGK